MIDPIEFFGHLVWLDGRPLLDTIEEYRRKILVEALYTFDDRGRPQYNMGVDWPRQEELEDG